MRLPDRLKRLLYAAGLPRPTKGADLARDFRLFLPALRVEIVFDVGANLGQSAELYLKAFPAAHVHSFEPVSATFEALRQSYGSHPRFTAHRQAFGAESGSAAMSLEGSSAHFSLVASSDGRAAPTETVAVDRLDDFCARTGISRINLLKIDTEGFDLEVLKGADLLLREGRIDAVQVEAGMNPENERHVSFEALKSHLEDRGYRLFALYDQKHEKEKGQPQMRRSNPLFISSQTIAANSR